MKNILGETIYGETLSKRELFLQELGARPCVFAALGATAVVGTTMTVGGLAAAAAPAIAGAAVAAGGSMLAANMSKGGGAAGGGVTSAKGGKSSKNPSFEPVSNVAYDPLQGSSDLLANYPNLAQFAAQATAFRTGQREQIMPGSGKQFAQASGVLQDWLGGNVPTDVVDFTNRQVAERTGGGFNPWTGGGNSQDAFARSIGKLSSDFQQMGISAAPAWQSLANSFVVGVEQVAPLALGYSNQRYQYDALNANIDQFNASGGTAQANRNYENNYTEGMNDRMWNQNQANQQNAQNMGWASLAANAATGVAGAYSGYRSPSTAVAPASTAGAAWTPAMDSKYPASGRPASQMSQW